MKFANNKIFLIYTMFL